ncbi:MAG: tetratricopeptide repeat protein [Prevotella sp.]|nr:tetratricopeptide repeat protein [Bacteroides sp.]MCM1366624.1 tetratricopeptide repeat protein [Prevotella sp.]MCM1436989.1 tetratricopeptide repeat protein [Prevotella sp.]
MNKILINAITVIIFTLTYVGLSNAQNNIAPDPAVSGIANADKLYAEQKYEDAIAVYDEVMEIDGVSAPILYNLGNACYKANQLGRAVLCYERALKLDPSNTQIRNNLQYVQTRIEDMNKAETKGRNLVVTPDAPSFFLGLYSNITTETSSNYWALFAAFSFVLLVGFLALYFFTKNVNARKCGFFGAILFLVFCVIFLIFAFAASKEYYSKDDGIVTAYKVELRTEPKMDAKPSTTPLNNGTKLSVIEIENDAKGNAVWYKVRLNSEFLGWISAKDFELI